MARDRLGALAVLGHALRYWRPHTGAAVLLVVLLLLQQGFGAMFAYALKHLIDHAIPARDGDAVLLVVVAVLAGYAIAALATIGSEYVGARTAGLSLRHLNPLPAGLDALLRRYRRVIVAENNSGQLWYHLRGKLLLDAERLNKVQGQPFHSSEIEAAVRASSDTTASATRDA